MLRLGIVGLPNVGKSTLFNALTSAGALVANYPFATIEPNTGVVQVPDPRLERLAELVQPGAHPARHGRVPRHRRPGQGREPGRGPRQPVPRQHPRGGRDRPRGALLRGRRHPARDGPGRPGARPRGHQHRARAGRPGRRWRSGSTRPRAPPSRAMPRRRSRRSCSSACARPWPTARRPAASVPDRGGAPGLSRASTCSPPSRCSTPPTCGEEEITGGNRHVDGAAAPPSRPTARRPRSSPSPPRSRPSWPSCRRRTGRTSSQSLGLEESGLDRLAHAAYHLLGLQSYFTAGEKEVRAWTIHRGDRAPAAAGVIHSDFEKGFIRAETVAYDDFVRVGWLEGRAGAGPGPGGRQGIRRAGRRRDAVPVQRLRTGLTPGGIS